MFVEEILRKNGVCHMKIMRRILEYREKIENFTMLRTAWMGIAILWIMWCHSGITFSNAQVNWVKYIGYGGVDIFVFCAGIGAYYSLAKDSDVARYLKRRVVRIIPTYWCFLLAWIPWYSHFNEMPIRAVIGNIFCVQDFTHKGNAFNWYMSAIWCFYILAPALKGIIDKINTRLLFVLWLLGIMLFTVSFWTSNTLIITVTRIPIFFAGMYWGKKSSEGCVLTFSVVVGAIIAGIVGGGSLFYATQYHSEYLWSHGLYWYPFLLLAPSLCILLTYLIRKNKVVNKCLDFLGNHSFEIYLIHVLLFDVYRQLVAKQLVGESKWGWLGVIVIVLLCSVVLRIFMESGKKCIMNVRERKVDK